MCFQFRVGLANKHKGFMLVQVPHGDVIALCPVMFIDALGVI
jgi:hypothetical protein